MTEKSSQLIIRAATSDDVTVLFQLIQAFAEYEKLPHAITRSVDELKAHLFSEQFYAKVMIAEWASKAVGYALFFYSYSTLSTQPGVCIENLFVLPEYQRQGIGKALISHVANFAVSQGCGYLEFKVRDENEPMIAFSRRLGASFRAAQQICSLTGEHLKRLGASN